jgi:hypothetical protein
VLPDRIYIQDSDKEIYDSLKEEAMFSEMGNMQLFALAMMIGYANHTRLQLKKRFGWVLTANIPEKSLHMMLGLAIAEQGDLSILLDGKGAFTIAEEYANGGINILKEMATGSDATEFADKLERLIEEATSNP